MSISRRGLLGGLSLLVAAPAVVRASSLMPVKAIPLTLEEWGSGVSRGEMLDMLWGEPVGKFVDGALFADFVKDFGGVGDGVTDNFAAFARAFSWSVRHAPDGIINLPHGNYAVGTASIPADLPLRGAPA